MNCFASPRSVWLDCAIDRSVGMVGRGPHSHGVRTRHRNGDRARHAFTIAATVSATENDVSVLHLLSSCESCQSGEDSVLRVDSRLLADHVVSEYLDTHLTTSPPHSNGNVRHFHICELRQAEGHPR